MTKFVPTFAVGATLYFAEHRGAPSRKVRVQSIEFRNRNSYVTVLTLEGTPYTMIRAGLHQLYNEPECNTHAGYMQLQNPGECYDWSATRDRGDYRSSEGSPEYMGSSCNSPRDRLELSGMRRHSDFFSSADDTLVRVRCWEYRWVRNQIIGAWVRFTTPSGAEYSISVHGKYHALRLEGSGALTRPLSRLKQYGSGWTLEAVQFSSDRGMVDS